MDGWTTQRRQVIKVSGGAVLQGCKKTRRKLLAHLQLRVEIHSQLRVIASLLFLRIFLTCLVGHPTQGRDPASEPPAVQPPRAPDAAPLPPLPMRALAQPASMEWECDPDPQPEPDPEPEPSPAPMPPALSEDPVMLEQLRVFCESFANSNDMTPYNQLQRRLVRKGQHREPILKSVFADPSNQELLAKLQQLGSINQTERFVKLYAKAARAMLGWSGVEAQVLIKLVCGYALNADSPELQASDLDPGPSTPLPAKRSKRTEAEQAAEPTQPTKGKAKGKAAKAKPAPSQAALNMQRIGDSRWHPLELCYWPEQAKLPAKGKEYPGLGYKRV
ncbi:hypothetical protein QJQ45_000454 [Haematococcus lacustris]|nr:hypothetical protein QJQ45_000454 [Haematococcus lacustris]